MSIFIILSLLTFTNITILLVPKRIVDEIGLLLTHIPFPKGLLLVVLSIIIPLGGIELTAQVLTKLQILRFDTPKKTLMPKKNSEDWRLAALTLDRYHEHDPVLFWRPIAKSPYTSQRFKGPKVVVPKPANVFRILCYGDSNTEGTIHFSWPEELHKILILEKVDGTWEYEVLNAGVAGYSSYQGLMRFREEVSVFEPDLIFVSFGWNDLPTAIGAPDKYFKPPHSSIVFLQRVLLKYRFYLCIKYYLRKVQKPVIVTDKPQPRVSLGDYVGNLNGFLETAEKFGTTVVFLTRPNTVLIDELEKRSSSEDEDVVPWRKYVPEYNRALLKFAKAKIAIVIDIKQKFDSYQYLFADEAHFTLEGHKKMAEMLYNELLRKSLLPTESK